MTRASKEGASRRPKREPAWRALGHKFRCIICGKLTTGRRPRGAWGEKSDGTFYYPRRHPDPKDPSESCPGRLHEAEWVKVDQDGRPVE